MRKSRWLSPVLALLCSGLHAGEIDLKLTTSDGSSRVSVVEGNGADVAAVDSSGNITFNSSLKPNGQAGTAGQVLQSNGLGAAPTWVPPTPLPATLLSSTNTWTAHQVFFQNVTISSNLVVDQAGVLSGNGSGLTNLLPGSITAGVYGAITGLGAQSQNLDLNSNLINNLGMPAAGTDAATKAYVDLSTTSAITTLFLDTNTWTAPQTFQTRVTVSSNLVVNNGGVVSGDGSGLTNLPPGSILAGILPSSVIASSLAANTVYPAAVLAGLYGTIAGIGAQGQNLNLNSNLINNLGTPTVGTDAATKAYVDLATTSVSPALLMATNTWTAQQTFTRPISISTSMALSGAFLAGGSAGSSGQLLQSQGSASAPVWISSTTLLGGTPILKLGPASLGVIAKSINYSMTAADFGILGNAAGGVITITLPAAANPGLIAFIVKTDASANNVNIAAAGSDTIQGGTPVNLTAADPKRLLIADGGTTWYVMSK